MPALTMELEQESPLMLVNRSLWYGVTVSDGPLLSTLSSPKPMDA